MGTSALVGWLSCLGCHLVHQVVAGSISGEGTCLCYRFSPQSGHVWEATEQQCFSFSLISKHTLG